MKPVINDDLWSVFTIEDTREVILECIRTSRALAELKGLMRAGSMHHAMSDYILLEEARASSAIEGVEAEFRDVFKASVTTEKDFGPAVREVIREADAIRECVGVAPSVKMLERICSTIRGSRTQMRRSGQDHSEVVNGRPVYSAPHGENVPTLMDQFVEFLSNSTCVDELVKSCMALLMFEAVSPFGEYSGRVGRAMLVSLLEHYGLAQGHCVLVSPYLAEHRDEYVQVLREAEMSGRSQGFILFMLRAIREGAFRTMQKLFTVDLVYVDVKEEMADSTLCNDALLNTIFEGIYCKSSNLIRNGIAERVTAMKYLRSLEEMGVLESEKVGREVVFKNVALYDALTR